MSSNSSQTGFRLGALLLLAASLIVIVVILAGIGNYFGLVRVLPGETAAPASRSTADDVTVVFSAAGLLVAVFTVWAAFETITRQQLENRRQRQMETLHRINERYDLIFDDVLKLQREARRANPDAAPEDVRVDQGELKRLYNRYFTTILTEFRYYRLGLVPREILSIGPSF